MQIQTFSLLKIPFPWKPGGGKVHTKHPCAVRLQEELNQNSRLPLTIHWRDDSFYPSSKCCLSTASMLHLSPYNLQGTDLMFVHTWASLRRFNLSLIENTEEKSLSGDTLVRWMETSWKLPWEKVCRPTPKPSAAKIAITVPVVLLCPQSKAWKSDRALSNSSSSPLLNSEIKPVT